VALLMTKRHYHQCTGC